jgi:uncharacterized protein (TIGR03435 family)
MTTMLFFAGWAIRSSIMILAGAILVGVLRIRDATLRWAVWTAMLCGSLLIPVMSTTLPSVNIGIPKAMERPAPMVDAPREPVTAEFPAGPPIEVHETPRGATTMQPSVPVAKPFDWGQAILSVYILISATLLSRVCFGLGISLVLLRRSLTTDIPGVRESDRISAPVTLGIARPSIVLPAGWRDWSSLKLEAILAHERSHIARWDPAVQLLSAIHHALLWASPLSWFLHQRIVRAAEEASDDAAVEATHDRTAYAESLLDFMKRGVWRSSTAGVPMARYGNPEHRIRRILDGGLPSRRMTKRSIAAMVALGSPLAYVIATAEPQNAKPDLAFNSVEIRAAAPNTMPQMRSRFGNGRYELHNATAVDLIRTASGVEADSVSGGPDWLDLNRYDVIAMAPATTAPDMLKTMLQSMLKDRFQLSVRNGNKDNPAYAITVERKPQLKPSEGIEASGCRFQPFPTVPRGAPLPRMTLVCNNVTIPAFAKILSGAPEASGYVFDYPLLDRTGLAGAWNFSLTWSPRRAYNWSPAPGEVVTLFDAFEKQLGLKLALTKVATPVLVVEKATTPRVTDAPKPDMEFEVAEIRPEDPNGPATPCGVINIQPGGRVRINMTLRNLIWEAWGAPFDFSRFIGGPKGMDSPCWQILAKIPVEQNVLGTVNPGGWNGAIWNGVDIDTMRMSLRSFLVDRFKLAAHLEDRPIDGYVLAGAGRRLKKANPANRPSCKEGPGDDGKDPRLTNPLATRLITCRNMTLTRYAEQLNGFFPGSPPMSDATGISGRFDMTINFSPVGLVQVVPSEPGDAPEPTGAISLFDALKGQLGLKVETRKVMAPVLIVDHVNATPTDN